MKGKTTKKSTLREFILITLAHAERRELTQQQIAHRLTSIFLCRDIVVAKETHEDKGFHFHIALHNTNASKNNATTLIRQAFTEFQGRQCDIKFHKTWPIMIAYITKQDKEPYVLGNYTLKEILEIGETARKKKKTSTKLKITQTIIQHLTDSQQWLQVYKSKDITERLIYGSYSNIRNVFDDIQVIKQIEKNPFQRIEEYLLIKQKEIGTTITEYEPEHIKEKYVLLDWIACNIACHRPIKTKQLLLYGPPSTQKTLIFDSLKKVLRIYFASARINDFAGADDFYDLWLYDEFHQVQVQNYDGTYTTTDAENAYQNTLLKVLDGQECRLDAKYSRIFTKKNNIPIVMIANCIPPRANVYGPFQERLLRLRFINYIQNLQEERIIATLKGCIQRRIKQQSLQNLNKEILLKYNQDYLSDLVLLKQPHPKTKELTLYNHARTQRGERIQIDTDIEDFITTNQYGEDTQSLQAFMKISIHPKNIIQQEISTLRFAIIPLKKRRTQINQNLNLNQNQKEHYQTLPIFQSKRKGSNFRIIRNLQKEKEDYMTWPIRMFYRNQKNGWAAEIDLEQELPMENEEIENTSQNINTGIEEHRINELLQITLGPTPHHKGINEKNILIWDDDIWNHND